MGNCCCLHSNYKEFSKYKMENNENGNDYYTILQSCEIDYENRLKIKNYRKNRELDKILFATPILNVYTNIDDLLTSQYIHDANNSLKQNIIIWCNTIDSELYNYYRIHNVYVLLQKIVLSYRCYDDQEIILKIFHM